MSLLKIFPGRPTVYNKTALTITVSSEFCDYRFVANSYKYV